MDIIIGIRPKIAPESPLEYKNLMKQCWDAVPLKRPDIQTHEKIREINIFNIRSCASKIYQLENLRNATEEEQEAFLNKPYDLLFLIIVIDGFNNSINQNCISTSKSNYISKDEEEIYNNPNFHPEEQDKLEIPDDGF
ncbi:hypothetical protein C1645_826146 [Glomus cerebriforme]|uniref:Serine-threonine/tyrosine-protein kinase catalytic domain-containing protein n=1 Tax=Glomus cerebriforme TaxID=658196 RepID=A0A397SRE8_9GLOM|nr:hypothetical protein C1645_826146 [Glomus cerebriforme]